MTIGELVFFRLETKRLSAMNESNTISQWDLVPAVSAHIINLSESMAQRSILKVASAFLINCQEAGRLEGIVVGVRVGQLIYEFDRTGGRVQEVNAPS